MEDLAEDTVWQALKAKNGEGLPGPGGDGSPRL
jgi:hypothetical protein